MSLFKGGERRSFMGNPTYNPMENPAVPLASLALDGMLGGGSNDSGEHVDPVNAMAVPTVYRCISVISTVIASSKLELVNRQGESSDWAPWASLQSYTAYEITEIMVTHMASWGNFFAFKVMAPGLSTNLLDLQPIFPGNVQVRRGAQGQKIFRVRVLASDPTNTSPGNKPDYRDYTEDQVLHVPFLGYDGLQGMSPLGAAALTVGTAVAADKLAARFYSNGTQLSGVINVKVPLADQHTADSIKQSWRAANQGNRNAGNVAVLDSETTFTPITIPPDSLQFLESRQWQKQEIATLFGIPLTMLSSESTGYGNAIEAQQEGIVAYTLRGYTDRIEQRLAREFTPRGSSLRFNLDGILRGATVERYTAYNMAVAGGWMSRAEVRASEGKPVAPKQGDNDLTDFLAPAAAGGQLALPAMTAPGQAPLNAPAQHLAGPGPSGGNDPGPTPAMPMPANKSRAEFRSADEVPDLDDMTADEYLASLSPPELKEFVDTGLLNPELNELVKNWEPGAEHRMDEGNFTIIKDTS